jgi:hypothetical protein
MAAELRPGNGAKPAQEDHHEQGEQVEPQEEVIGPGELVGQGQRARHCLLRVGQQAAAFCGSWPPALLPGSAGGEKIT